MEADVNDFMICLENSKFNDLCNNSIKYSVKPTIDIEKQNNESELPVLSVAELDKILTPCEHPPKLESADKCQNVPTFNPIFQNCTNITFNFGKH